MSPRPYQLGRRQEATDQTRANILAAARHLLMGEGGISGFTIEAVARLAGVARMTVYYQFGSKVGLLEAISDDLAARGQMERLAEAFGRPDPFDALAVLIASFARFWGAERPVIRRLRALAALDPDFAHVVRTRDEWRRNSVRAIVGRIIAQHGELVTLPPEEAVNVLFTLTSFESFDSLAGVAHTPEEVAPLIRQLAYATLSMDAPKGT